MSVCERVLACGCSWSSLEEKLNGRVVSHSCESSRCRPSRLSPYSRLKDGPDFGIGMRIDFGERPEIDFADIEDVGTGGENNFSIWRWMRYGWMYAGRY